MGDFVKPEIVRLTLADGKFVDIKKRLNHGETEELHARWSPSVIFDKDGKELGSLNRREVRTAKVLAYLIGWSLTDDEGKPVPMTAKMPDDERLSTVLGLDPDRFTEIHEAIEAHEQAFEKAREALKKTKSTGKVVATTAPSPSVAESPLTTSVN